MAKHKISAQIHPSLKHTSNRFIDLLGLSWLYLNCEGVLVSEKTGFLFMSRLNPFMQYYYDFNPHTYIYLFYGSNL